MMTIAKASAIAGGLMLAMAIGVWTGRHFSPRDIALSNDDATVTAPASDAAQAANLTPSRRADGTHAVLTTRPAAVGTIAISTREPALQEQLKPLLNSGTNLDVASEGFANAEEFAAVAHAARNTEVPFMLLKHRVVTERKSLSEAIKESKPEVNAEVEANRAVAEARSDLAKLSS